MATPVPIAALAGDAAVRQALGLSDASWSLSNFQRSPSRPSFPQPIFRNKNFFVFDLRDIRAWAKATLRRFTAEVDIDAGPTIDPDRLATIGTVARLVDMSTPWVTYQTTKSGSDFPQPVVSFPRRYFWDIEAVETWAAATGRKTYQPPVEQPPAGT